MEPTTVEVKVTRKPDSAPNDVILKALEELLIEKFPNSTFKYDIEKASGKGDNYMGVVYRIIAQITDAKHEEEKTYKLIIKTPPESELQRKNLMFLDYFHQETKAYNEFLTLVIEFQHSRGLAEEEIFKSFPKCFKTMSEDKNEAIFLEDLCTRGYRMFNRFKEIDSEHVSHVMRAYGQLHAVSFAIKDQIPEKLKRFIAMDDVFKIEALQMFGPYFESLKERSINSLDDVVDREYKEKYVKFLENKNIFELFIKLINGKLIENYAVVCHGDCWNNNILFQYNEENKPIMASLLDWQIMRFASPITDIMYYLFSSTLQNFRKEHFKDMLNIYYESLASHITRLGSDPEKLFPRDAFEKNLQEFGVVGLIFAMMVLPVIVTLPENCVDFDDIGEIIESGKMDEMLSDTSKENPFFVEATMKEYNERMRGIIIDIIDYNYI